MKALGGSVNAGCRGQGAEADGDAHTADCDDRCAGALQDGEEDSGPSQQFQTRGK